MGTVLFAEDERYSVEAYASRLQAEGHTVLYADNIEQAWELLEEADVDVLVLDIMMPLKPLDKLLKEGHQAILDAPKREVRAGAELYGVVRRQFPHVKVIILSILTRDDLRGLAPDVTFDCSFRRKGEDPEAIYETIRIALNGN